MNEADRTMEFTVDEINHQSRENAESLWLTTVAYFIEKGSGLENWVDYVGASYALGWEELK